VILKKKHKLSKENQERMGEELDTMKRREKQKICRTGKQGNGITGFVISTRNIFVFTAPASHLIQTLLPHMYNLAAVLN
jgi:hypothetical protein